MNLWRHRDFMRLWSAQTVSEFGSQFTLLALPLTAILVLHSTAFEVAVLSSVAFLPFLLFGAVAGVWVDRLPYRLVLVGADLGRALVLASIPVAYAFHALTLPQLYAAGFLSGSLTVMFSVAYSAFLPSLLEPARLAEGNSRLEVSRSLAQTSGPATAGGMISAVSAPVAIVVDTASFLASAVAIFSIRHREARPAKGGERSVLRELREGLRHVWREPILRSNVFSAGLANFAYGMVWAVLLVFAVRILGLHAAPRGAASFFLTAGWALGSFGAMITAVIGPTIRQVVVPQRLQGRVVGAIRSVIMGVVPLGSVTAGALAATIGIREALFIAAGLACVAFVPLVGPLRNLDRLPVPEAGA
jgi:MFS family permease